MRRIGLVLLGALFCFPTIANSGWVYDEDTDLMRNAVTKTAMLRSSVASPATGQGLSASLTVIARENNSFGVVIGVDGDVIRCAKDECQMQLRFDHGSVKTLTGPFEDGDRFFAPWDQGVFARAIQHADELIVELDLQRFGRQQFVFDVSGMPIAVGELPDGPVLKYQYGTLQKDMGELGGVLVEDAETICRKSVQDLGRIVMDGASGGGMVCFVKDRLYLVVLEVPKKDKKTIKTISDHLDSIYGGKEAYSGDYTRWPKVPEGVNEFTSRATRFGSMFIFTDDSLELLTKKSPSK